MDSTRRKLLAASTLLVVLRPTAATPADLAIALRSYTGGATLNKGRVKFDIAELVDNGNAVPVTVSVDSPMSATDYVTGIAIFNEKNPLPDVVRFTLGPRAGKAQVSTRIRLATSQTLTAVARMSDGSFWSASAEVVVTLAACIEGAG
jgi:sulfur-oxidizing protein SoxY